MSPHLGWDRVSYEKDSKECSFCAVCDAEMIKSGPQGVSVDWFECPYSYDGWHNQLYDLRNRLDQESSQKISALLEEEIEEIMQSHIPTRRSYGR